MKGCAYCFDRLLDLQQSSSGLEDHAEESEWANWIVFCRLRLNWSWATDCSLDKIMCLPSSRRPHPHPQGIILKGCYLEQSSSSQVAASTATRLRSERHQNRIGANHPESGKNQTKRSHLVKESFPERSEIENEMCAGTYSIISRFKLFSKILLVI